MNNEVVGGSPLEWGCESWADAVAWEAGLEKIRPPDPWWAYKIAIARATGSPVGSRMAEVQGADDWQDARPVRDLFEAGATVGQAVAVLRVARDLALWSRGYGSPHSPPARLVWLALRRRWIRPLDKQRTDSSGKIIGDPRRNITAIVDAYGGGAAARLPYNALAIAKVAVALRNQFTRLLSNQQTGGWACPEYLLWAAKQVAKGRVHFYAALSALAAVGRVLATGALVDRDRFRSILWNEAKRPLHAVRREVASPKALWGLAGVKVSRDVRVRPDGIKTAVVKGLLGNQGVPPGDDLVLPAVNLAKAYGREAARVVEVYGDLHDAGQLPVVSAEAGAYVLRHLKVLREKAVRGEDFHREVSLLHARWLPEMEQMAWSQAVKAARGQAYKGLAKELAVACSEAGLSEARAEEYRRLWEDRKIPEVDELPNLLVHGSDVGLSGDWVFRRIARNDPTGPLLGILTNCCQHPWGAGSSCAKHGTESRYGGFYAVFYNGRVVAQSWAWIGESAGNHRGLRAWLRQSWINLAGDAVARKERILVFDNIEALSSSYQEGILALYRAAAALALDAGFSHVHVGQGYSGVSLDSLPTAYAVSPLDYNGYRDSHSQARLASRSSMAHAMANLEAQIYPPQFQQGVEGFEEDLKDEERIGLVMLHGDRPVGYVMALVLNDGVEIEDLAVLPEYRGKDCLGKRPASHVLLAELVERVNSLLRRRRWTIRGEARHFSARLHRHFDDLVEVIEEEPFYCPDRQENLVRFVYRIK